MNDGHGHHSLAETERGKNRMAPRPWSAWVVKDVFRGGIYKKR